MSGALYLADTNVLLRLVKRDDPKYPVVRAAVTALEDQGIQLAYTFQNMTELWNTFTRPRERNGFASSVEEAESSAREIDLSFVFLVDSESIYRRWRQLVFEQKISGVQVHDARLVAAMYVHGLTHILTFNQGDFTRYASITAVNPAGVGD